MVINTKTTKGYLQAISGVFISKEHPGGLTPKELDIITAFLFVMDDEEGEITSEVKDKVSALFNHPRQVITNYVKKLRDKGVITRANKIHKLILSNETTIRQKEQDDV